MQRLDESPDFRPFKFRIQAFTNAYLEEVNSSLFAGSISINFDNSSACTARLPRGEDTHEKSAGHHHKFQYILLTSLVAQIRNFLWNQPYISRFNEEGKKSKSKGNHIWHVDAKKCDGGWQFRPFKRKLAGAPPGVAYIGLRWSWTPRIWDPQASRTNLPVQYSSPSLPPWLSWENDTLSGIPTPDAQSCDLTVEARVRVSCSKHNTISFSF